MSRMSAEEKCAAAVAKNSTSIAELKMKLQLNNLELYNINILRRVFNQIANKKIFWEFKQDIAEHVNELTPGNYVDNFIDSYYWKFRLGIKQNISRFDAFLGKLWMDKHENLWRKNHGKQ